MNPAVRFQAAAKFDRRVMPDLQPLGERANRGFQSRRAPLDCEKRLMLLRFDTRSARRTFAEIQEPANFVAKVCERVVMDRARNRFPHTHKYIVSRYNMRSQKLHKCRNEEIIGAKTCWGLFDGAPRSGFRRGKNRGAPLRMTTREGLRQRENVNGINGDDGNVLLAVLALIRHRIRVGILSDFRDPQFLAGLRVECAEPVIRRRTDED